MKITALPGLIPCIVMIGILTAQTAPPKAILGKVTGFKLRSHEIAMQPDSGDPVNVPFSPDTEVLRIAPGLHDLSKAAPAKITDIHSGDRLLISFADGMTEARRIVLIKAADIDARNAADHQDWQNRGIWGVVTAKNGSEITLRTFQGGQTGTVTVTSATRFRRYAPDSIKFENAGPSTLAEIAKGDQARARGVRSADGLKVTAEELVFGTFVTAGGTITAVNFPAHEITINDISTKKSLTVRLAPDSLVKGLSFGTGGHAGGSPFSGPAGMAHMIDQMPPAQLDDLKVGGMVSVTSTKGSQNGRVTAILLLNDAGPIVGMIQQAQAMAGMGGQHSVDSMHAGIITAEGVTFPGMIQ